MDSFFYFSFSFINLITLYSGYFHIIPSWSLIWSDLIFGQRGILLQQIDNVNKFCKFSSGFIAEKQILVQIAHIDEMVLKVNDVMES